MSTPTSEVRPVAYRTRRGAGHNRVCYYSYRTGSVVLLESKSIKGEQCQQKMLDVTGVMEVQRWGDEERFEAAVHTEEGPKSLKGTVVNPCSCIDIQSGAIPRWQVVFREADEAIRNAYDTLALERPRGSYRRFGSNSTAPVNWRQQEAGCLSGSWKSRDWLPCQNGLKINERSYWRPTKTKWRQVRTRSVARNSSSELRLLRFPKARPWRPRSK